MGLRSPENTGPGVVGVSELTGEVAGDDGIRGVSGDIGGLSAPEGLTPGATDGELIWVAGDIAGAVTGGIMDGEVTGGNVAGDFAGATDDGVIFCDAGDFAGAVTGGVAAGDVAGAITGEVVDGGFFVAGDFDTGDVAGAITGDVVAGDFSGVVAGDFETGDVDGAITGDIVAGDGFGGFPSAGVAIGVGDEMGDFEAACGADNGGEVADGAPGACALPESVAAKIKSASPKRQCIFT